MRPYAFTPQDLSNTLGEYLSKLGKTQLRIAETEKYAHVTFFFNGGVETAFPWVKSGCLIPSPKVATYDLQPEMSAPEVTRRVVEEIDKGIYDLIVLNYANCDMVGHTGVMEAAVRGRGNGGRGLRRRCLEAIKRNNGQAIITADHGNAERMVDPETAKPVYSPYHKLVPVWLFNSKL
jgi:2,3-bisphosphoglycerate-independent phosphoglycerate mutase